MYYAIFKLKEGGCITTNNYDTVHELLQAVRAFRKYYAHEIAYEYWYEGFEQINAYDWSYDKEFWNKIEVNKGIDIKKYKV